MKLRIIRLMSVNGVAVANLQPICVLRSFIYCLRIWFNPRVMYVRRIYRKIDIVAFVLIFLSALLFVSLSSSCSHNQDSAVILKEAFTLAYEGRYDEAQIKALESEELLTDNASLKNRESLTRLYGLIFYQQNIRDKAKNNLQQALNYATELNDTSLIIINLHNLGLCATTKEEAISNFSQAAAFAEKAGFASQQSSALEKLAQTYIFIGDFSKAQQFLDNANELCNNNNILQAEIATTQCRLWLAEGKYDAALQGYESLNQDSLNVYGRLQRTNAIYDILVQQGDYKTALAYKDSIFIYTDSIRQLDGSKRVEDIEKSYHASIAEKNRKFQLLVWSLVLTVAVILVILFFALKTLRLKKRQVELNDKISALNARIAGLMPKSDENDKETEPAEKDIASISRLIEQKYELSLEVFKSLPQYESLRKLNLIREMSNENKTEIKSLYDAIVGRFSGCCSDTRQTFPGLTNDDCVFCTMNFVGCSKEVISAAMGSSEEALRRRKSRIKQKLPESIFMFFFQR